MPNRATRRRRPQREPDLIDGLTRAELREKIEIEERLAGGGEGLREFIERIAPEHAPVPRHLDPLISAIERARHQRVRVCLSMPPGHAKTLTVQRAIVWWLQATPADTCAYLSYSDRQAWGKSKLNRELALYDSIELDPAFTSGAEWRTAEGGGLLAAGRDGRLTGQRVTGFAVIDDPFKGRLDAESMASREAVWSFFTSTVRTRLEQASIIVVHTRWHADDLIGRLEKADTGWEVINLPALAEPDDPLGREPGEALWPEMYDEDELDDARRDMGEYEFSAVYQGRPRPRGAKVFKEAHYYDPRTVDLTGCRVVIYGDPAASKKTTSNHSAILALYYRGAGPEAIGYVKEVYHHQVEIPQYCNDLRAFQARHGDAEAHVEAVAGFRAVPQIIKAVDPNARVVGHTPVGDKFQRAQPAAAAWNDGRILVPLPTAEAPAPWLKDFLAEVGEFTGVNDAADDQVDCLSGCWNVARATPVYEAPKRKILPRRV